jgi:putative ABC transport system substrate-binding protein
VVRVALALLLAAPPVAYAQPASKIPRIGFLSPIAPGSTIEAFRQGMKEMGYVEGRNVVIEARFAEGHQNLAALPAKNATTTVPIVFAGLFDPVASGVVQNLARPGGNITGVTVGIGGAGFAGKWVELLKAMVPNLSHVAVLSNARNSFSAVPATEIQATARSLKVKVDVVDAGSAATLESSLASVGTSGAQGIIVTNDPFFAANRGRIIDFVASKRLPAVYFFKLFADAGGLMSYGGSLEDSYRRAAGYVDRILKGARPGDLPIEQPTKIELVINVKTARALGIKVPQTLLLQADRLIE